MSATLSNQGKLGKEPLALFRMVPLITFKTHEVSKLAAAAANPGAFVCFLYAATTVTLACGGGPRGLSTYKMATQSPLQYHLPEITTGWLIQVYVNRFASSWRQ
jgi:hypothetical protein